MKLILEISIIAFIALIFNFSSAFCQIQSPAEFLGYSLGSRYTRHHQIVDYFKYVAKQSNQVITLESGSTYEERPLIYSIISSKSNLDNIEKIRRTNLVNIGFAEGDKFEKAPVIVWLSYNVHGNETSGSEAAMEVLFKLSKDDDEQIQQWLENTVIILDPCLNPDGRDRYVNWFYQTSNSIPNANPESIEHQEPWLRGRYNHYIFDMNRDWAWATQKETRHRLSLYHQWMPHVHIDVHEQGYNNNYYFGPAAKPVHNLVTPWQMEIQEMISKNHIKHFDQKNWLYFRKENYDLLYPSYGDSYPSFNGAIGITYEMPGGGSAGAAVQTKKGDTLTLKERIEKHVISSISTIEAVHGYSDEILENFKEFFASTSHLEGSYIIKNRVEDKTSELTKFLDIHHIKYGKLAAEKKLEATNYHSQDEVNVEVSENDLIIPKNQFKSTLIEVLFERYTQLQDSLTYDITAWNLPFAWGLECYSTDVDLNIEEYKNTISNNAMELPKAYGYAFQYSSVKDAAFLLKLLVAGIKCSVSESSFQLHNKTFSAGSFLVLSGENKRTHQWHQKLSDLVNQYERNCEVLQSGSEIAPFDAGSNNFSVLTSPKIALLSHGITNPISVGELWYFFEQELKYPVNRLHVNYLDRLNLSKYDVIIVPDLNGSLSQNEVLIEYIKGGGNVIAIKDAVSAFKPKEGDPSLTKVNNRNKKVSPAKSERDKVSSNTLGAIFSAEVSKDHPLAYGYDENMYVQLLSSDFFKANNKVKPVVKLPEKVESLNGFIGNEALKLVGGSTLVAHEKRGKGNIIYFTEDPVFRAYWQDTKLMFINSVLMYNRK